MIDNPNNLVQLLQDERLDEFFGPGWLLRADCLCLHLTGHGGSMSAVARRHGVTHQAVSKHMKRARAVFGPPQLEVAVDSSASLK